ncbi:iron ABC transporter permease [Leucothrix sargassi]|nr:iron ABC transporter permease [Leucothrix sargassi]
MLCALLLITVSCLSLYIGAVKVSPQDVISAFSQSLGLSDEPAGRYQSILIDIRFPRVVLAILVGAALAVSGAAMQGLFRNPLADPGLVGISSGAALAAVIVIVLVPSFTNIPKSLNIYLIPIATFIGSLLVTLIVHQLSQVHGKTEVSTLLLAGIAINAIAGAGTGLLTYMADDTQLRILTFWSMGSLGSANWPQLIFAIPLITMALIGIHCYAKALNAIALGEAEAGHLGYNLESIKRRLIILVALAVGTSVALSGTIGFIGLVIPHLLRLFIGPNHRKLLPLSAILGAALLLLSDLIARTLVAPAELPIGIITTIIGGPFFLWLLLRFKRQGSII